MALADENCVTPRAGDPPLQPDEARKLAAETPGWRLLDNEITTELRFADFRGAMAFVNEVAKIAESQGHHPDIGISYSRVTLTLSTHKIGGLSRNDFILAARIDRVAASR